MPSSELSASRSRAIARLSREADVALAALDLSQSQYRLLALLTDQPLGASRVAELLALSPPSVTSLLAGLSARDLVVRRPDKDDGRRVVVALTARGRKLAARADKAVANRIHDVAAHANGGRGPQGLLASLDGWSDALDRARAVRR